MPGSARQLGIDDVEAKLVIGRVDVGDQAPAEARKDARRDPVEVLRRAIRGDHQAAAGGDDLVHRVEEFFLRRILAGDELDVVDQQQVGRAQPALEADRVIFPQRADELDHELLGRHRHDPRARAALEEGLADGVQQVGLAATGAAVNEQRVEGDAVGGGQRLGGRGRNLVGLADDKGFEAIALVEIGRRRIALGNACRRGGNFLEDQQAARDAGHRRPQRS